MDSLINMIQNPLQPDLGKAGSPYARTVPKMKHMHGVPPDPGLLFDCKLFLLPPNVFIVMLTSLSAHGS